MVVLSLYMGARLVSFCLRLLMNDHHWKDGKWFKGKEPIDSVTKKEANEPFRVSGGDSFITHRTYIAGRLEKDTNTKSATLFFHQVGQIWSCRALVFFWNPHREIYKLGMVPRLVL